ncbi:S8 family serine peptidase [Alteromonas gilva]|uniref:S8 family serine peptidase n=1 Tax=Alteromonas gilva TaxID=2987522 RepID=A0ABT5L3V2_9ALTE|nr:S8 family serine peptidase [Alteromonas gilva]MDC8831725.1 S8 family serine peptidase [Alteromonas gilva]
MTAWLAVTGVNAAPDNNPSATIQPQRYIVQLHDKTLSRYMAEAQSVATTQSKPGKASRPNLLSVKALDYRKTLRAKQNALISSLRQTAPAIKVHHQFQSLFNGFAVVAPAEQIQSLRQHPEVKKIYKDHLRYVHLDASHDLINTPEVWEVVGGQSEAGKGIKIAIIDSGIRNDNPMFFDDGFDAPDLSSNTYLAENPDYCRAPDGDPGFCNNKIIVARWVDPLEHDVFGLDSNEYMSPLGLNRHGSHVAGIAAGNPVNIEYNGVSTTLSGVAPGSYLMIYKGLYASQGSTFGSDSMLLEALEHAVNDGADIINNSWGAFAGESPESSVYADVFANAEALGITIVNSAGNNGGIDQGSINCPGCIESGITVANTMHGRFFGHKLTVDGDSYVAVQGKNTSLEQDQSLPLRSFSEFGAQMSDGCSYPFASATFNNAAVLVDYRANCDMQTVAQNVKLAGGQVAILYQSTVPDSQSNGPFTPYDLDYAVPVLGVSRATGLTLFEKAHASNSVVEIASQVSRIIDPEFADTLNDSSSRGPNANPNVLKPDLAAPGTSILSASAPEVNAGPGPFDPFNPFDPEIPTEPAQEGPVFTLISGTSMSSPHIAGAAALLKQAHPDWTTTDIKSALTSTASQQVTFRGVTAKPFEVGAGRVQLDAALNAKLTFSKPSYANAACIGRCYFNNVLHNQSDNEESWFVEVQLDNNAARTVISEGSMITLGAKGEADDSKQLNIEIDTTLVDAGVWVFGKVIFSHPNYASQHLPIAVFANDNSDKTALSTMAANVAVDGNVQISTVVRNFDFTQAPQLSVSLPENVEFIDDSQLATVNRGQTEQLQFDAATTTLKWTGNLQPGFMQLTPVTPWGSTTLASLDIPAIACLTNCFDFSHVVDFNFEYYGQSYSALTLSSNGFAMPGNVAVNPFAMDNRRQFPSQDELNNVIAPLWANYSEFNTGENGARLRATIRNVNGSRYLIAEWDSLSVFGMDDGAEQNETFSFQLIIEENTDNIWFNYLNIPYMPQGATIGAENLEGLVGVNYYFNGQGSRLPVPVSQQSYTLKLDSEPTGEAVIQFDVRLANNQQSTMPDQVTIAEDASIDIGVLNNDTGTLAFTFDADLNAGSTYQTSRLVMVSAQSDFDAGSLEITQAPEHGSASIANGNVQYIPNDDYYGADTLAYRVADNYGHYSVPTPVSINVTPVNDAPQVSVQPRYEVKPGEQITLVAQAQDVDSTALQFNWQQTTGVIVDVEQQGNQITFTAPDNEMTMQFEVTVSDGELVSPAAKVSVIVTNPKSGGSVYVLNIMLALMLLWRLRSKTRGA